MLLYIHTAQGKHMYVTIGRADKQELLRVHCLLDTGIVWRACLPSYYSHLYDSILTRKVYT